MNFRRTVRLGSFTFMIGRRNFLKFWTLIVAERGLSSPIPCRIRLLCEVKPGVTSSTMSTCLTQVRVPSHLSSWLGRSPRKTGWWSFSRRRRLSPIALLASSSRGQTSSHTLSIKGFLKAVRSGFFFKGPNVIIAMVRQLIQLGLWKIHHARTRWPSKMQHRGHGSRLRCQLMHTKLKAVQRAGSHLFARLSDSSAGSCGHSI